MNLRSGRGVEPLIPNGDDISDNEGDAADNEGDEGEDDGNGRDIRNPPGVHPAGRRPEPHFNNRKFRATLTGSSNYHAYWQKLESHFYGCGPEFSKFWHRAQRDESLSDPDPLPSVDDTNARRVAWETVFNSLSPKEAAKVKSIRIGAVEKLLRKIRVVYDAQSDASLDQLRRSYHGAKLAQYEDLAAYIAFLENCVAEFAKYGKELDLNDRKFRLLEGLPPDYDAAVTALRLPGSHFTWQQLTSYLFNYAATNSRIAGAVKVTKAADRVLSTTDTSVTEVCRNFTNTGKCRFGKKCKYVHPELPADKRQTKAPPTPPKAPGRKTLKCFNCGGPHHVRQCQQPCPYCNEKGHSEQRCFKKQNDQGSVNAANSGQDAAAAAQPARDLAVASASSQPSADASAVFVTPPSSPYFCFSASSLFDGTSLQASSGWSVPANHFVLDGGANCCVITDPSRHTVSDRRPANLSVNVGGKNKVQCRELCTLHLDQRTLGGDCSGITIKDVRICPAFGINIIPECVFLARGSKIVKSYDSSSKLALCTVVSRTGVVMVRCTQHYSKLFLIGPRGCRQTHCPASAQACTHHDSLAYVVRNYSQQDALTRWHVRLGHRNFFDVA